MDLCPYVLGGKGARVKDFLQKLPVLLSCLHGVNDKFIPAIKDKNNKLKQSAVSEAYSKVSPAAKNTNPRTTENTRW